MEMTALEFISICLCWFCCGIAVKGCIDDRRKRSTKEEVTIEGWVARDKRGYIFLSYGKPRRTTNSSCNFWVRREGETYELPNTLFPSLRWEDEPIEVELPIIIKKENSYE